MNFTTHPPRDEAPSSQTKSPLLTWWHHHADDVNDACLSATGSVAGAIGLRRDLDAAARGELAIDDPRLRLVVGYLVNRCGPSAAEAIRAHREWEARQ